MSKTCAFFVVLVAITQDVPAAEVVIEGAFGRAVIDTASPSVVAIVLRRTMAPSNPNRFCPREVCLGSAGCLTGEPRR